MSETLATFQRVAGAIGDVHAANVDIDAHLEEITRIAVNGRANSPSRLPRVKPQPRTEDQHDRSR